MGNVIDLYGKDREGRAEDHDADETLRDLIGKLDAFVLTGYAHNGDEVVAITFGHLPEALWSLERAKKYIISRPDDSFFEDA